MTDLYFTSLWVAPPTKAVQCELSASWEGRPGAKRLALPTAERAADTVS